MSDARKEIEAKLALAEEQLDSTLRMKQEAERAVSDIEATLRECEEAMQALLQAEGAQRLTVAELKNMRDAFDALPEGESHG